MTNILITFDYEMFFGSKSGTQNECINNPTNRLLKVLDKYNIKTTFFIDSGYLIKLNEYRRKYRILEKDYQSVISQIEMLNKNGHDIQLHIHPHWEDSFFDGNKWIVDSTMYKLHEFSESNIFDIVYRYKKVLTDIVGNKVFAFRAGGWCIQPFNKLHTALRENNIWLDSTLFENGHNESKSHFFDFREMPKLSEYNFGKDPLLVKENGFFTEIPISSYKVSPWFYWKFAYYKKFGGLEHQMFGNGKGLSSGSKWNKIEMLTKISHMAVSVDGYKSILLQKAFRKFEKNHSTSNSNFVIIGHPKAQTNYSLEHLDLFIKNIENENHNFTTYTEKFQR